MEPPEVGVSHGEIAIRPVARLEEQEVAGAVHRLDAELPLVDLRPVHVLVVVLVVAGELEELGVEDLRRQDFLVAALRVLGPQVFEQAVVQDGPLRQEERRSRRQRYQSPARPVATAMNEAGS